MAEPWDAREEGAALLAAVTRAIAAERMGAAIAGRLLQDADLARAVLRSPALQEANRRNLDGMLAEAEPRVTAAIETAALERFGDIITAGVDRQLAERMPVIEAAVRADERERLAAVIPPAQFRSMADWFDADDDFKVTMFPGQWLRRDHEVQDDLRRFADLLDGAGPEGQERSDEEGPGHGSGS